MRAFIAIELPQEIKDALASLQERLKISGADVKWVEPKNIHLTLKFLGEVDETKLIEITGILDDVAAAHRIFQARVASTGAFPKPAFPRVIWAGITLGDNETREIYEDLEERLSFAGIPKEDRPFSSHITIGRVRSSLNKDRLAQDLKTAGTLEGKNFKVLRLTLFKSTLTPKGPAYEALKEANLKAS